MTVVLAVLGIVLVALVVLAAVSIKVVREYQRVVLFRLGRASGARGPGLIVINPITDRISSVDLREPGDPSPDGDHPRQRSHSY
jgi:regulator of protease activity HflC (stomatin/prohibitin superfamily)